MKAHANYNYLVSWKPKNGSSSKTVKSDFSNPSELIASKQKGGKRDQQLESFALNSRDILKTFSIAAVIFIGQAMLYFFLK